MRDVVSFSVMLLVMFNLVACGNSDDKKSNTEVAKTTPVPGPNAKLHLSVLPGYLVDDNQVHVYDLTEGETLVSQLTLSPGEDGLGSVSGELSRDHLYKIVFNPDNESVRLRCPLYNGCFKKSLFNQTSESVAFGQVMETRLQVTSIIHLSTEKQLVMNLTTDLAAKLVESDYVEEINPHTIKQTQSVVANTLGLLAYDMYFEDPGLDLWNQRLTAAVNAGILFDERVLHNNATSRLKTVYRRLSATVADNTNKIDELNAYVLDDAVLFLKDQVLNDDELDAGERPLLARLRAYLLSKNIYPEKGYLPSPYIEEESLVQGKRFLDDFRSVLYTFQDDSQSYEQVNDVVVTGYQLIDDFSSKILVDLFAVFGDVLSAVPLGSDDGLHYVDGLAVTYEDAKLQWLLKGQYKQQTLDLLVTIQSFSFDPFQGNSYNIAVEGQINGADIQTKIDNTQFDLKFYPADDPFSSGPDGSGFIAVKADVEMQQQQSIFTGKMTARIDMFADPDGNIIESLESASIFGELSEDQLSHKLSLAIVHPDIFGETNNKLISDDTVAVVSYSASLQGLGEPLLSLYVDPTAIDGGISVSDIDTLAYFEGRLARFSFAGKPKDFTYQGMNQDGGQWDLTVKKKEASGQVTLNGQEVGKPRVLKDLPGIMFNDGNFISIF